MSDQHSTIWFWNVNIKPEFLLRGVDSFIRVDLF